MNNAGLLEDLTEIIENKYLAANIAAKRARWLNDRKKLSEIETDAIKNTTIALEELLANKLSYKSIQPEETRKIEELMPSTLDTSDEEDFEEESDSIFEEEYIDDSNIDYNDEEPEEGI